MSKPASACWLASRSALSSRTSFQTAITPRARRAEPMEIHYLGHAAFELSDGATTILIDPFITGNPSATVAAADLSPDVILLTHGHGDHYGDVVPIAKRTGATVVAITEIADQLAEDGLEHVLGPNLGGTVVF